MAVLKMYPNGGAMSRGRGQSVPPVGVKRGRVAGWSTQAAARHVAWLMSVDAHALVELEGRELFAFTLTVRDTPPDAASFHVARRAWEKRAKRILGSDLRICWVMEWQRRGAPHLHGVLAPRVAPTNAQLVARLVYVSWPEVVGCGTTATGQDVKRTTSAAGWLAYLSKHIGRPSGHAQRVGMPPGWEASGRLWGHSQGWPTRETVADLDLGTWYALRRLLHGWRMASARSERDPAVRARRIGALKRARRRVTREASPWVGLREWVPPHVLDRLLAAAAADGGSVIVLADRVTADGVTLDHVTGQVS